MAHARCHLALLVAVADSGLAAFSQPWLQRPLPPSRSAVLRACDSSEAFYKPPRLEKPLEVGQVIPCTVLAKQVSGGYTVDVGAAQPAFLPKNEVALKPNQTVGRRDLGQGWAPLDPGMVFEASVMAVSADGVANVSLARLHRDIAWKRAAQLAEEDVTLQATVLRMSSIGATLDVEQLPAFLPWSHWPLPEAERTEAWFGAPLPVKFLEVDRLRSRLVVSHRRHTLEKAIDDLGLQPGAVVEGVVRKVSEVGATVRLAEGVNGLLHVSQLSQVYVRNVSAAVAPGDAISCVIINVDASEGAIGLSTKMLEATPGEMLSDAKGVHERAKEQGVPRASAESA